VRREPIEGIRLGRADATNVDEARPSLGEDRVFGHDGREQLVDVVDVATERHADELAGGRRALHEPSITAVRAATAP
jgi:hypothetical protein